jgi:hypothetical protein
MDNNYLIFILDRETEFDEGSFEEHLNYLKRFCGTPDMWGAESDLADAIDKARTLQGHEVAVVDENDDHKILWQKKIQ